MPEGLEDWDQHKKKDFGPDNFEQRFGKKVTFENCLEYGQGDPKIISIDFIVRKVMGKPLGA